MPTIVFLLKYERIGVNESDENEREREREKNGIIFAKIGKVIVMVKISTDIKT